MWHRLGIRLCYRLAGCYGTGLGRWPHLIRMLLDFLSALPALSYLDDNMAALALKCFEDLAKVVGQSACGN